METDAQVPELDADTGTGTEGDVEARCFSEYSRFLSISHMGSTDSYQRETPLVIN